MSDKRLETSSESRRPTADGRPPAISPSAVGGPLSRLTRRRFLVHAGWVGALAVFIYQVGRFLGAPGLDSGPPPRVQVDAPEALAQGDVVYVPEARAWVRREGDGYAALDAVCPHLGCIVRQAQDQEGFYCPCHGSRFAADGALLQGPAEKALRDLDVETVDGALVVRVR